MKFFKSSLSVMMASALAVNVNAGEVYETLGEHLPKPGVPTATQMKFSGEKVVDTDNFLHAETDKYFSEIALGLPINTLYHMRKMTTAQSQTVVRMNRDTMYSKGLYDTKGGVTFTLPVLDTYQSLQIIDEAHRTIDVLYSEEGVNQITVTPDMLSEGRYVMIIVRTQVKNIQEEGLVEGRARQDLVKVDSSKSAAKPYEPKGFDQVTREKTRMELEAQIAGLDITKAFGGPDLERLAKKDMVIGAAMGWGGLPSEHAFYQPMVAVDRSGTCQEVSFTQPPLRDKGFFSITTYGPDGYIHADDYATSNREGELVANEDGSYTVRFNCPDAQNNLDVMAGWSAVMRLYKPTSIAAIKAYAKSIKRPDAPTK